MIAGARIVVGGRVQGVFFREFTRTQALKNGLRGTVQNQPDGTVRIAVEGEKVALLSFIEKIRRGPFFSRVDNVSIEWTEATNRFSSFIVIV